MSRKARIRAAAAAAVALAIGLLFATGTVQGVFASFSAETENSGSAFAGGWLGLPTVTSATASGDDVILTWVHAATGGQDSQALWGVTNGTTNSCTGVTYASRQTGLGVALNTVTDPNSGNLPTGAQSGDYYCYEVISTLSTSPTWTTAATFGVVQVGLAATILAVTNGNGSIATNDTIKLTFNQRPTNTITSIRVCTYRTQKTIVLGDTTGACTAATDTSSIGKIVTTGTLGYGNQTCATSGVAYSAVAPWTATITLGGCGGTQTDGTGTWTFTGPTSAGTVLKSYATTHQATLCNLARSTCQPTTNGTF